MHKVWILVSGLVIVVVIGGAAYFLEMPGNSNMPKTAAPQLPAHDTPMLVVPGANPLLTADTRQLRMWVPSYPIRCGEIVFENADPKDQNFSFCVGEIRKRVATVTGHPLGSGDVLDSRVKAHWHDVMGAR